MNWDKFSIGEWKETKDSRRVIRFTDDKQPAFFKIVGYPEKIERVYKTKDEENPLIVKRWKMSVIDMEDGVQKDLECPYQVIDQLRKLHEYLMDKKIKRSFLQRLIHRLKYRFSELYRKEYDKHVFEDKEFRITRSFDKDKGFFDYQVRMVDTK